VVSFSFDDFPRSAYTVGGSILKDLGARGTFYTSLGFANSASRFGEKFRLDDLYALTADGHELASHTLNHVSSRTTSVSAFVQEVREGRAAMQQLPDLTVSNNFAYPFGAVTMAAKRAVGREMLSCRGTTHGVNGPVVDLNLLRANPLYGEVDRLDCVRSLLSTNEQVRGWLIFYTHDICVSPSPYGCTGTLFESVVRLVREASMKILTVNEVVAKWVRKPDPPTV
jgi:peptidoglycan/xylan/chitin deacetylase (PgdA/CDA1 family)